MNFIFDSKEIPTPSIIGKNIQNAIRLLSDTNLNGRLLTEKIDADLPSGTILSQTPKAGHKIKPQQSVFFIVSKKPDCKVSPLLLNKKEDELITELNELHIPYKIHYLPYHYPKKSCFAQYPKHNQLIGETLQLYLCSGQNKPFILPSLKNFAVLDVAEFFQEHQIQYQVNHTQKVGADHNCSECMIIDQKPLAGSLLNPKKQIALQLFVRF